MGVPPCELKKNVSMLSITQQNLVYIGCPKPAKKRTLQQMVRCPSESVVNMETCSFRRLSKALAQSTLEKFVSKWGSKHRYATNS